MSRRRRPLTMTLTTRPGTPRRATETERRLGVPMWTGSVRFDGFRTPLRRVKEPPSAQAPRGRWVSYFAQQFSLTAVVEHGFEYIGDCSRTAFEAGLDLLDTEIFWPRRD